MRTRSLRSAFTVGVVSLSPLFFACNGERKEECDRFLAAMKPLDSLDAKRPSADIVDHVQSSVAAIQFQTQPLAVFSKNLQSTITVLSNAIKLQASDSAPDGTGDVVKTKLKEAITQRDDAARYCAQ